VAKTPWPANRTTKTVVLRAQMDQDRTSGQWIGGAVSRDQGIGRRSDFAQVFLLDAQPDDAFPDIPFLGESYPKLLAVLGRVSVRTKS